MTTINTTGAAAVATVSGSGNLYPFMTKAMIAARLEEEPSFRVEALCILHTLQTEHEQATRSTLNRNKMGFMSSHAVHGSRIAEKVKAGLAQGDCLGVVMATVLTVDDWAKVDSIAPRYTKQLAAYFRAREIAENPALAKVAALFSAG